MKKIVCFIESIAGGGAEHQMVILCNLLSEKGYDVTLVTYADLPDHYTLSERVHRKRILKTKSQIVKLLAIFSYFCRVEADCVISFRQACNARVLIPLLFRRDINVICSERNLTHGKPGLYEHLLFRFLYKRTNIIVSNSNSQKEYIAEHYPNYICKLFVIYNYTDIDHYKPVYNQVHSTTSRIAVFARFSKQKNCIRFAKAISFLRQKTSESFEIHWYGNSSGCVNGLSKEFIELQDFLKENSISDIFIIHSPVKDTATLITNFDAICLPSLFEGFSNSIAEAICCGMPMLVSDVSDNRIMVHDGENGFLFNPYEENEIVAAFQKFFYKSEEQRSLMGKCSRKIAESLFEKSRFIESYIKLIEDGHN